RLTEILAQLAAAARGGLRVAHHLFQALAVVRVSLLVFAEQRVELLGRERANRTQLAPTALGGFRCDQLRGDHFDALLGQRRRSGCRACRSRARTRWSPPSRVSRPT